MNKHSRLLWVMLMMLVVVFLFSANWGSGQAASTPRPPLLNPTIPVPVSGTIPALSGYRDPVWYLWWLDLPLSDITRWTFNAAGVVTGFEGILHVDAGLGWSPPSTRLPTNGMSIGVPCVVSGPGSITLSTSIMPPMANFNGAYLICQWPSIADAVRSLVYRPSLIIRSYEYMGPNLPSNASLLVDVNARGVGPVISQHPSFYLSKLALGQYQISTLDGFSILSTSSSQVYFTATEHLSTPPFSACVPAPVPPTGGYVSNALRFELAPYTAIWNGQCVSRPGDTFVWWMYDTKFRVGEGFMGLLGNIRIDPRSSQSTGG